MSLVKVCGLMAAMVRCLPMLVVFNNCKQVLTGLSRYFLTQLTRVYRVEADGILLVGSWCSSCCGAVVVPYAAVLQVLCVLWVGAGGWLNGRISTYKSY